MPIYFPDMSTTSPFTQAVADNKRVMTRCSALQIHHAQCEVNFLHLQRLLPGFPCGQQKLVDVTLGARHTQRISLCVAERNPYTAQVVLHQEKPVWGGRGIELHVRAYLDVCMAEVVGSPPINRLLPRYPYPNPRMLARDEKWQLNRLLGEWLSLCISDGHAAGDASIALCG